MRPLFKFLIIACALPIGTARAGTLAEFRGGPAHLGSFEDKGPDGFFTLAWRFDAGHQVIASPVIANGLLYVGARNGKFFALDSASGARKWEFDGDSGVTSTAAVADGVVYFISDANTVYALDAASGTERWHRQTGQTLPFDAMAGFRMSQDWDYWASSPLVEKGRVYVGSGDGALYALDAANGDIIWRHKTGARLRTSPASDGRTIYAGNFAGEMHAVDARTGKLRWIFKTHGNPVFPAGSIQSSPTLAGGFVLFGARDFNLYAVDARSGREVWHQAVKDSWVPSTPAADATTVYVGSADGRALLAFDLATGAKRWEKSLDNLVFSSPVLAGGNVYVGTMGGTMFAIRVSDGAFVGYTLTQDRILSTPWIEGGTIFFGDNDGHVYAFTSGPHRYPGG